MLVFIWMVLIPSLSYYAYQYFQLRHESAIAKRNVTTIIVMCCLVLAWLGLERTFTLVRSSFYREGDDEYKALDMLVTIVAAFVPHGIAFCFMIRYWALFYRIKWSLYAEQMRWTQLLNPHTKEQNWFLREKPRYGNHIWMLYHIWTPGYVANVVLSMFSFSLARTKKKANKNVLPLPPF